jgi:hypothetical protein
MIRIPKSVVSFAALALAAGALTLAVPRAAHALTAALVEVSNSPASPASLQRKRRYPFNEFSIFQTAAQRYAELAKSDALIHRAVAEAVHGLLDFLEAERKRVPADVLRDPHFEGDEPPGV